MITMLCFLISFFVITAGANAFTCVSLDKKKKGCNVWRCCPQSVHGFPVSPAVFFFLNLNG